MLVFVLLGYTVETFQNNMKSLAATRVIRVALKMEPSSPTSFYKM